MRKKLLIVGGLLVVLVSVLFVYLSTAEGFFDVRLAVMNDVQEFQFTDQNGNAVTDKTLEGKIYVTEYFFTTCTGICPKMNANMVKVYDQYKDNGDFAILSHTSMPETDSVEVLKNYEEKLIGKDGGDSHPAKWYFVTGSKDSLYRMARQSYLLDDPANNSLNIDESFIHTQFFALVDGKKRVRGIYDGLKGDEVAQLQKDIEHLMKER